MAGAGDGGAEAFFVRLVRALGAAGETERAVMRPNHGRAAALRAAGIEVVEAPFGGPFDLRTTGILRRAVDGFAPDILMSWMSRAARFAGWARRGRRFVHVGRLGGYYKLKYYGGCDHLIGNTPGIVEYLVREGWPAARAHFVPNFVDAAAAAPARREDFDTPPDAPLLLLLARLHVNKAVDVAIKAVAKLPHAYLWIAGDGPLRRELEALARTDAAERVRFLGWRDDVAALLAAADVLVCPSRHEPLGNVVIEGWAHGVPVVAAESAGPAWLIEDGLTGKLAPVDDVDALASTVDSLLADRDGRERLIAGGRARFEAEFTEEAVVARYRALFAAIAG